LRCGGARAFVDAWRASYFLLSAPLPKNSAPRRFSAGNPWVWVQSQVKSPIHSHAERGVIRVKVT